MFYTNSQVQIKYIYLVKLEILFHSCEILNNPKTIVKVVNVWFTDFESTIMTNDQIYKQIIICAVNIY